MKLCAKSHRVIWSFRSWTHASSRSVSHSPIATKAQSLPSSAARGRTGKTSAGVLRCSSRNSRTGCGPKTTSRLLRPLLPERYAPLQSNGNGLQSVYLTELPPALAEVLIGLIGDEVAPISAAGREVKPVVTDDLDAWERRLERSVADDISIPETDRLAIIRARKGQGLFKDRVSRIESRCRITGVDNPIHLVASHCKPWRDATNEERLDGENGLLLTPSIDHLFDRGFIGFEDNGRLIISPVAHRPSLLRMGIDTTTALNVGSFTGGQKRFLDFHRNAVLLRADRIVGAAGPKPSTRVAQHKGRCVTQLSAVSAMLRRN